MKKSDFDLFTINNEIGFLNEQDVEDIHWKLIQSTNIDINSEKNPIAISFREHLYTKLELLLKEREFDENLREKKG